MLAITTPRRPQGPPAVVTPNILPCKIAHSGPIPAAKRHWDPQPSATTPDTQTAYFRGRKLQGKKIALPDGYEGKVLLKTDVLLPQPSHSPEREVEEEDDEDGEVPAEVKQAEVTSTFDSIVVWNHEALPGSEDAYIQGLVEWPEFAARIHDYDTPASTTTT